MCCFGRFGNAPGTDPLIARTQRGVRGRDVSIPSDAHEAHTWLLFEPSQRLLETALATRRRILGEEHSDTLSTLDNLATVLNAQGRLDEAEPLYRQAIETSRRVLVHRDRQTLKMVSNLCTVVRQQGKFDEAEGLCREAVDGLRELGGINDQDAIVALQILGAGHVEQARLIPLWPESSTTSPSCKLGKAGSMPVTPTSSAPF